MKKTIFFAFSLLLFNNIARSQGCIAIRNISGFGQYNLTDNAFSTSSWLLDVTTRYFKAFRDFKEKTDQHTAEANQTILKSYSMDIGISRLLNNGWSVNFSLPITSNSRSSTLEHGGLNTTRHTTHSFGMGDVRITAYKWLFAPSVRQKGNIQLGLGIKLPTGDYKYQDYFYRNDTTKLLSAVNPFIQLGDGGTGIITELNAFYFLTKSISIYGNFYYLSNPRDQNGTQFTTGRTPTPLQVQSGYVELSVPDVYSMRIGASFNVDNWGFSAGLRNEGSPVEDLFGASNGARRAGHNLSFEPGVVYKFKKATIFMYTPIIMVHEIKQNLPDKKITEITGVYTVGAGGSGDYQVFLGVQFKL